MIKNLSDLKKQLQVGTKLKTIYHFRNDEKYLEDREIVKIQTSGVYTTSESLNKIFLEFPKSSLIDFDNNKFTIYQSGYRNLNEKELLILENLKTIDKKNPFGNSAYYKQKEYAKINDCEYMLGCKETKGLYYDMNKNLIRDNNIKGEILYIFEIL